MKAYELTLLSPLYYRSRIESGAAGATITSPWIGDLSMMYAINNTFCYKQIKFGYASHKPNYSEIADLGFVLSVLEPVSECRFTKVFDIATSFISEGYPQGKAIADSGRAPMRNWMRRQGIEPGNKFSFVGCFLEDRAKFSESFTVRLGNTRESLAIVKEKPIQDIKEITLNLYSLSLILGPDRFSEILKDIKSGRYHISVEQASSQYILARGVPISVASRFFAPFN
jgi:hypothetical protein